MNTTVLLVSLATFASTMTGGLFALRLHGRLHLILGFSSGAVLGVALFDLVPEAISLTGNRVGLPATMGVVAAGFLLYMLLDRALVMHGHAVPGLTPQRRRGVLGAGALSVHSFLDGLSIGLAFQVSIAAGAVVAVAVLVHDFSDGINTVGVILRNRGAQAAALRWLLVDALAPLAGAASTLMLRLDRSTLGTMLAAFAGFFLYIGAADLLPESYREHPTAGTTAMTILGALSMFVAVRLASG